MAKKQSIDWVGTAIKIAYGNGETFTGETTDLPPSMYVDCACARHGLGQKLGDAKSGGTAAEKHAEVKLIWASMVGGEFNRRSGGGTTAELMAEVFTRLAPDAKTAAKWTAEYASATEDVQAEVRAKGPIKTCLEAIKAERRLAAATSGEEEFSPFA